MCDSDLVAAAKSSPREDLGALRLAGAVAQLCRSQAGSLARWPSRFALIRDARTPQNISEGRLGSFCVQVSASRKPGTCETLA